MMKMNEKTVGLLLCKLRQFRMKSIDQLAQEADISISTIYRWENEEVMPHATELKRALTALEATDMQLRSALMLLQTPQAAFELIKISKSSFEELHEWPSWMPGAGELWRAMRLRRGLTVKELTAIVRVDSARVSNWEHSKCAPPKDRLEALFFTLNAYPEERAALSGRNIYLCAPMGSRSEVLASCEEAIHGLRERIGNDPSMPGDLCFITIESLLFPFAQTSKQALTLLSLSYCIHGEYLMWRNRLKEMNEYANRALRIFDRVLETEAFQTIALNLTAQYKRQTDPKKGVLRALQTLDEGLEFAEKKGAGIDFLRGMGELAGDAKQFEQALTYVQLSRSKAEIQGDEGAIRLANIIESRILIRSGHSQKALPMLAKDDNINPCMHIFEQLLWVEALVELESWSDASRWLQIFYTTISENKLEYQRWQGDLLSKRIG